MNYLIITPGQGDQTASGNGCLDRVAVTDEQQLLRLLIFILYDNSPSPVRIEKSEIINTGCRKTLSTNSDGTTANYSGAVSQRIILTIANQSFVVIAQRNHSKACIIVKVGTILGVQHQIPHQYAPTPAF